LALSTGIRTTKPCFVVDAGAVASSSASVVPPLDFVSQQLESPVGFWVTPAIVYLLPLATQPHGALKIIQGGHYAV
jgi:hypothetical protein